MAAEVRVNAPTVNNTAASGAMTHLACITEK